VFKNEVAPFLRDKRRIGLKRIANVYVLRVPFLLDLKRLPIKVDWEDKRLSRMPKNGNAVLHERRGQKNLEDLLKCRYRYLFVQGAMREIAVATIDVAEWRRLDNYKLCLH
jgi:hypothetical protein